MELARLFGAVFAVDPGREQIRNAIPHERVDYRVAPAEETGIADRSVDLVTAEIGPALRGAWGSEGRRRVSWPLALRVGRIARVSEEGQA